MMSVQEVVVHTLAKESAGEISAGKSESDCLREDIEVKRQSF